MVQTMGNNHPGGESGGKLIDRSLLLGIGGDVQSHTAYTLPLLQLFYGVA